MKSRNKNFRLREDVADAYETWIDERRWLSQGVLVERLLTLAMRMDNAGLVALLQSPESFVVVEANAGPAALAQEHLEQVDRAKKEPGSSAKEHRGKRGAG